MRSKTPEDDLISWLESRGEETEILERVDKGQQREQSSDRAEEEREIEEQEDKNAMEGVEEGSSDCSPVAYSVRTGARQSCFLEFFIIF